MSGAGLIARALLLGALLAGNASAQSVTVVENVEYAPGLQLNVFEPAERGTTPRPAVVLIHGGGWTSLDKSTMTGMGNFLARKGFVAFSVDYRLYDGTKNRWPAQLDDVQRAVRWVRANASTYGVNAERIGAFGHSAGGQLAALLGMEDTRDNSDTALSRYSSRVQAVVDASAPSDFTAEKGHESVTFLTGFLGADSSRHEVWQDASPVNHAMKGDAPFLVVHGTNDPSVPIARAQELVDTLQAKGVPVSFVKIDAGHVFETPAAKLQLALKTLAFFHQYLDTP
jgi:acetyl esterase/lipase